MRRINLARTTAVLAIVAANGAFADVTPEEVWQNWHDMASAYGQSVTTAGIARDGDTLVVTGLTITMTDATNNGDSVSTTIDTLNFTDAGDGSVDITMSETYPLMFKSAAMGTDAAKDATVLISAPKMTISASGTPAAVSYDIKAPSLTATLDSLDGAPASATNMVAEAIISNLSANYLVEGEANAKTLASQFSADNVSLKVAGSDAETKATFDMTAAVADLAGQSNGTLGTSMMTEDLAEALRLGAAFGASLTHGPASFALTADEGNGPTEISGSFGDGSVRAALDQDRMRYSIAGSKTTFNMNGPDIPLPVVAVGYDELVFDLDFPVSKSDAAKDFTALSKIVGLTISEDMWGMIDMQSLLPHDPTTLIIDTKGKVKVKADVFADIDMAEANDLPIDIEALDLTELKLSLAGAEFTGNGSLTFDNSDKESFDGMPVPTGKIDLKLTGGNTLLDKIVEMGYLSAEDVMGFRMMAAMVANSSADKDELTSALEFKDKGFYANGQRLK